MAVSWPWSTRPLRLARQESGHVQQENEGQVEILVRVESSSENKSLQRKILSVYIGAATSHKIVSPRNVGVGSRTEASTRGSIF